MGDELVKETAPLVPFRPPVLCPGCGHRSAAHAMKTAARRVIKASGKDIEPIFPSDIGCYALIGWPPLEVADTAICMGGSFGPATGLAHAVENPVIAHCGDSTFFHAGIPPLINAIYTKAKATMVVLDNLATGMTGFQPHSGTGRTAMGEETIQIKIEDVARGCGAQFVEVVDPNDLKAAIDTLEGAIKFEGTAVVVLRRLCAIRK